MPIRFHCSGCQYLLQVPDDAAGKKARCPRCQNVADVPLTSQVAAGSENIAAEQSPSTPPWPQQPVVRPTPKPVYSDNPYQSPSYSYDEGKFGAGGFGGEGKQELRPSQIVLEEVFRNGWEIYLRQMGILIGVGLVVLGFNFARGAISNVITGFMERDGVDPGVIQLVIQGLNLGTWPIVVFLEVGQAIVFLKVARGQPVEFGEVFSGGRFFLRALGGSFLYNLAVGLGMCALIVPGILLSLMLWPYLLFIVDRDQRVFESFSSAQQFTNGNKGTMFVLFLANFGIMLLGCLALCVGVVFTYPLITMFITVSYLMMTGQFYRKA